MIVHYQIPTKPNFFQRMALRLIGLAVLLLSDAPMRGLYLYFGVYWNLGVMFMANAHENIVNHGVENV